MNDEGSGFTKTVEEMQLEVQEEEKRMNTWRNLLTDPRFLSIYFALFSICFLVMGFAHKYGEYLISQIDDIISSITTNMVFGDFLLVIGVILFIMAIIIKKSEDKET